MLTAGKIPTILKYTDLNVLVLKLYIPLIELNRRIINSKNIGEVF